MRQIYILHCEISIAVFDLKTDWEKEQEMRQTKFSDKKISLFLNGTKMRSKRWGNFVKNVPFFRIENSNKIKLKIKDETKKQR